MMKTLDRPSSAVNDHHKLGRQVETTGAILLRAALVIVLLWVGALKFTAYEAEAVANFVENSPLLSWMLDLFSVRVFSGLLGAFEIALGLMIAARPVAPRISAIGSFGALLLFLVTLTFVFSTPGAWQPGYGIPYLSPDPGQFLAKDVAFAAIAIWTAGEALRATGKPDSSPLTGIELGQRAQPMSRPTMSTGAGRT